MGCIAGVIAGVERSWGGIPIGPWSEWIAAAVTLAAVWVAIQATRRASADAERALVETEKAIRLANDALALDRERWRTDVDERERAQAQLVVVQDSGQPGLARIVNHSDAVIVDVRAFVLVQGGTLWRSDDPLGCDLEPKQDWRSGPTWKGLNVTNSGDRVGFTFRDIAGRYWARYANGALVSLRGTDPESILSQPASWPNH